jgi:hypothetical protein
MLLRQIITTLTPSPSILFLCLIVSQFHLYFADDFVDLIDGRSTGEYRGYYKREHSLVKPYQGSLIITHIFANHLTMKPGAGLDIPNWNILGNTMVLQNEIRLTRDIQSQAGAIWNVVVTYRILYLFLK